jgi:hypothetical protein
VQLLSPKPGLHSLFPKNGSVLTKCRFVTELISGVGGAEPEKQHPVSGCSGQNSIRCGTKGQRDLELLGKISVHVSLQREAKVGMLIKEDAQL